MSISLIRFTFTFNAEIFSWFCFPRPGLTVLRQWTWTFQFPAPAPWIVRLQARISIPNPWVTSEKLKCYPFSFSLNSDGCLQNNKAGPGEVTQLAKCLSHKYKDVLILKTHGKEPGIVAVLLIPGLGGRGRQLPGAHWPACLACIVNSRVPGRRHTAEKKKKKLMMPEKWYPG